jgi:hypothetical protein
LARVSRMQRVDREMLKAYFIAWQCRVRQQSVREFGGQPAPAMRPRASTRSGTLIMPLITVLLVPEDPLASTAFFKFQVQKTNEMKEAREAALQHLGADYFQLPELFSDEMTAVFAAGSPNAASLLGAKDVLLDFEQYAQSFRVACAVRGLRATEPARESSLWQARLFNPNVPRDAKVLGFKPDWMRTTAHPMPQSVLSRRGRALSVGY